MNQLTMLTSISITTNGPASDAIKLKLLAMPKPLRSASAMITASDGMMGNARNTNGINTVIAAELLAASAEITIW